MNLHILCTRGVICSIFTNMGKAIVLRLKIVGNLYRKYSKKIAIRSCRFDMIWIVVNWTRIYIFHINAWTCNLFWKFIKIKKTLNCYNFENNNLQSIKDNIEALKFVSLKRFSIYFIIFWFLIVYRLNSIKKRKFLYRYNPENSDFRSTNRGSLEAR